MVEGEKPDMDPQSIVARIPGGKSKSRHHKNGIVYAQGDAANSVYLIETGTVKVTVLSSEGREATVGILQSGDFFGEECLSGHRLRIASATAVTECVLFRLEKASIVRALGDDPTFSYVFISYLMARNGRMQADLVDLLLNSVEKRLARLLLILANYGKEERPETLVPRLSQETLAEMIGASRTNVNFFMNKFRQLELIEYNGNIKVKSSLLNMLLRISPEIER